MFLAYPLTNHCDKCSWRLGARVKGLGMRNQTLPKHKGVGGGGVAPEGNIASCYQRENGCRKERKGKTDAHYIWTSAKRITVQGKKKNLP